MDESDQISSETINVVQEIEKNFIQNNENSESTTKDIVNVQSKEIFSDYADAVESTNTVEVNEKDVYIAEDIVSIKAEETVSSNSIEQTTQETTAITEKSENSEIEKESNEETEGKENLEKLEESKTDTTEKKTCITEESENSNIEEERKKETQGKENQEKSDEKEGSQQKEEKEAHPVSPSGISTTQENDSKEDVSAHVFKKPQQPTHVRTVANNLGNYAEHVTYEEDGTAIYTDPKTKYQYKWSEKENNWISAAVSVDGKENPFENEHYRWCAETQSWKPKETQITETEHYKWDAEKNEWIPKVSDENNGNTYSVDEEGQRIYTDKDGAVYFWDEEKSAWFPKIDDDFMARYQMNYGFIDNVSVGEEEKRQKEAEEEKRKAEELKYMAEEAREAMDAASGSGLKRKTNQDSSKWFEIDAAHNTKVYVSNLPLDITLDEFAELMGKCGMIMRDPQTQKYKLKLYTEADGQIKGDGLCDYIKVESVNLALNILDEYVYRGNKIRVQRAKFEMRGEYNPALKPKRKKKDKEKLQKMKERLFDWRPEKMRGERTKNEKVVIIKNLFTPDVFEKDIKLILDYQNDLREECEKCGTVRKVTIYDCHPEGVAQINMASPEEADLVIQMMQGRYFGKRQLSAEHWDGKTKYKISESEKDVKERLSNWDQFLEADTDKADEKTC